MTDTDLRVLLRTEKENSHGDKWFKASVSAVTLGDDGHLRSLGAEYYSNPFAGYADLSIRAQLDVDHARRGGGLYGYKLEYHDVYSVDLQRAEMMVKTIKRIERGMAKLEARFGAPTDFVTFVTRFADVIGAPLIGWVTKQGRFLGNDTEYRWGSANDFRFHVEHEMHEWKKENNLLEQDA